MTDFLNRKISWVKFKLPALRFEEVDGVAEDEDDEFSSEWVNSEKANDPMAGLMGTGGSFLGTPMGIIATETKNEYERSYNMWMGHVNFDLTKQHILSINKIPGVDGLQPVSRYRFNVIIGFNFDEVEVKKAIEHALVGDLESYLSAYAIIASNINPVLPPEVDNQFHAALSLIDLRHYGILVLPNGKMVIVKSGKLNENFIKDIHTLQLAQGATEAYLYVHNGQKKIL